MALLSLTCADGVFVHAESVVSYMYDYGHA